jgi:hypothetical protein
MHHVQCIIMTVSSVKCAYVCCLQVQGSRLVAAIVKNCYVNDQSELGTAHPQETINE